MEYELLKNTLRLARETKLPAARICKEIDVSIRWYYRFVAGEYKDPGVQRVLRLHRYLTQIESNEEVRHKADAA